MRIKCEMGVVVRLDETRTSSIKGGTYEVDDKHGKCALKRKGVTDVTKPKATEGKKGAQDAN